MKYVLIVCAHPDDETYGMGGTILKHTNNGDTVHVLVVTDGSSAQYRNKDYKSMIKKKKEEAKSAMKILNVEKIEFNTLPDMKLDTVPHIEINEVIEKKVEEFEPDNVYTHFWGDINRDHREVFKSTMVACRPTISNSVKKILCYETPSCTEWGWCTFKPNLYVKLTLSLVDKKMQAIFCYESEIRDWPHPRNPDAVMYQMKHYGSTCGYYAAERFQIIREII